MPVRHRVRQVSRDKYAVGVYDRAGEFERIECDGFGDVLRTVAAKRAAYPGKVVEAFNLDRCDYDTNGLTEDQREALDEVQS